MAKTNRSGQKLYPFNCTENTNKLKYMQEHIHMHIKMLQNGTAKQYPGEQEILENSLSEIKELIGMCSDSGIIYLTGNLLSRVKNWILEYNRVTCTETEDPS